MNHNPILEEIRTRAQCPRSPSLRLVIPSEVEGSAVAFRRFERARLQKPALSEVEGCSNNLINIEGYGLQPVYKSGKMMQSPPRRTTEGMIFPN
jgi:hypothetical protein